MSKSEIKTGNYQELQNECNKIRDLVFVQEQNVPREIELDDRDEACIHVVLTVDQHLVGTGRIDIEKEGKIGRLAVLKQFRHRGYGTLILQQLEKIAQAKGLQSVWLNAQKPSLNFYQKRGYEVISDEFIEANIVHQTMKKKL